MVINSQTHKKEEEERRSILSSIILLYCIRERRAVKTEKGKNGKESVASERAVPNAKASEQHYHKPTKAKAKAKTDKNTMLFESETIHIPSKYGRLFCFNISITTSTSTRSSSSTSRWRRLSFRLGKSVSPHRPWRRSSRYRFRPWRL